LKDANAGNRGLNQMRVWMHEYQEPCNKIGFVKMEGKLGCSYIIVEVSAMQKIKEY